MRVFDCPALDPPYVELTDEREHHVQARHPDLLPSHLPEFIETLRTPDTVKPSSYNANKHVIFKWFGDIRGGKFVVVHVITEWGDPTRHWIVTAYLDSVSPS